MKGKTGREEGKIRRTIAWCQSHWQVLLFWLACAFAGWYLGAKGYGIRLYFSLAGIDPQEWTPHLRLTAQKDPKVGSTVSLDGLTDWQGKPVKLPFPDKTTALWFVCSGCGLEETLQVAQAFQNRHADKVKTAIVYVGKPNAEFFRLWRNFSNMLLVRDAQLVVFERLNALYMPRLYLISPDGTLRYLSPLTSRLWRAERWQRELEKVGARLRW